MHAQGMPHAERSPKRRGGTKSRSPARKRTSAMMTANRKGRTNIETHHL